MGAFASKLGVVTVLGALACASLAGCINKNKSGATQAELESLKDHILDAIPNDPKIKKVDVNFDDKIHLVGWKAEPELAPPGTHVNFTLYWQRTADLDEGWELFTHITADNPHDAIGNLDCVGAIRQDKSPGGACSAQLYGPSAWEKGKVIADTFDYTVPDEKDESKKLKTPKLRFMVGVWKESARLHVKNAESADDDNRANVVVIDTGIKPEPPKPPKTTVITPSLVAPKLGKTETINLDGKLDEPIWQKAGNTGPFVSPGDGSAQPTSPVTGSAKMVWDDTNLYVAFTVLDKDPTSPFKATDKDPRIWEKSSAVELMVQPGNLGDNKDYYEIQVDTNGATFDSHWDDYNTPITGGPDEATKVFGHMDWASQTKHGVSIDKGKSYTIELAIPWASFVKPRVAAPPVNGDTWRINLYSFRDGQKQALAWSSINKEGNFHKSTRFGMVRFSDGTPLPVPSVVPAPSVSASGSAMPPPGTLAPGIVPKGIRRPPMQMTPLPLK
ncbi:MAG: carbohydrate-binding family 9-like protein [Polyangiales bacterium]